MRDPSNNRGAARAAMAATVMLACIVLCMLAAGCVPPRTGGDRRGRGDSGHVEITRAFNLRIHGAGDPASPPILRIPVDGKPATGIGNDALTVEFEMQSQALPAISMQLVHCDRNWVPTENIFVQDPMRLRGNDFEIERAPVSATHYDYIVRCTIPGAAGGPHVQFAGNYLVRIIDYYNTGTVLAEGRFFAVETRAGVGVEVYSDFYESAQTKVLQNGLKVRVEAVPNNDLFGGRITAIDLYRAGEWSSPIVADQESEPSYAQGEPWVTWAPSLLGKTVATYANLPAGNEHRLLDLSDLTLYPTTGAPLTTVLSDIPRNSFLAYDNDGATPDRLVPWSDADYVYFAFRLDLEGKRVREDLFVVGTFNNWTPTREWQMHFDTTTKFYIAKGLMRRAYHEYQYVAGNWDDDAGVLRNADATLLEGNNKLATQPYYALVYYHETSGGALDKIVGIGLGLSGQLR